MRGNRRSAVVLCVLAAAGLGCGGSRSTPFSAPSVVSMSTNNGATPMFLVGDNGRRVLSWVSADSGGTDGVLHFEVVGPGGGDTVRSTLRDPLGGIEPHGESPPQLAMGGDGRLYVAYTVGRETSDRFPPSALRFSRSDDGGRSWSDPESVNEGATFGSHSFHALLAAPDGTVYISWLNSIAGSSGVWLRASHDGGRSWQPSRAIHDAPTCPCCRTGLALAADGTLYLSFRKVFDGEIRDVVVMTSRDGGAEWTEPVRPQADDWVFAGCPHAGPSLRVDRNGVAHIAWWTGKPGAAGVWYGRSEDHGAHWTTQPIDTSGRASPAHVQLAIGQNGAVVVSWDDGLSGTPRILVRASTDGGGRFGATTTASSGAVAATFPVLGLDGDSIIVAWSQTSDSAYRAEMAARPDMKMPGSRMPLPRVGQQEVFATSASLLRLTGGR